MSSLADLKRAVVLAPDDAHARYALAEALFAEGQYAAAATQLEKAMALAPDDGNVRRLLARSYERDGKAPRAQAVLEDLVRRDHGDVDARDELITFCLQQGRLDDALVHANEVVKRRPDEVKRHLTFAELLRQRGLNERARQVLEAAQRRFLDEAAVARDLREVLVALGDEVASDRVAGERDRAYFQRQAQRALTSAHVDALVANTPLASVVKLLLAGQLAEASKAFTASAEVVQDTAGFAWLKGEWALLEGQYEQAEALFRQALSKRPELGLAWNRLGDLAQMRHDLRGALTLYKKAILHGEEDANALEDLGDIYATLGQTAQAEKAYRRAIAKDPSARANDKLASLTAPPVAATSVAAVGRIGVLAWTPVGGSARPVEAVAVPGRGALRCSGNVGEAITESAAVAFSVIKARSVDLAIDGLVRTFDLHLHFTDTNVTKDGPSAGLALFLAGVSAYTQKALKPGLAATGELTLHGHVGPVGGIHEKLVAAHLAGYRAVVLPKQNLKEARALPVEVTAAIELIFVDNVADAIARALAETPKGTP